MGKNPRVINQLSIKHAGQLSDPTLFCRNPKYIVSGPSHWQGDRIGRIFDQWVIVYPWVKITEIAYLQK
jgi:hypothetical protein